MYTIDDLHNAIATTDSAAVERGIGGVLHGVQQLKQWEQLVSVGMVWLAMCDRLNIPPNKVYELADNIRRSREDRSGFNAMWMFFQLEWRV